jgi:UDP-N-acetylmuramate-alanine ligase
LAEAITKNGVETHAAPFSEIEKQLGEAKDGDVIITMGAGDIYKVANALVDV